MGYGPAHWLCDNWGEPDPTMFECETCGETGHHSKLHEVEMGDGFVYTMCGNCRSYYQAQGFTFGIEEPVEQNTRLMELAM